MNRLNTNGKIAFPAILALSLIANFSLAQEATKVDSAHYKVEFENDQVRIIRINYGAHEKSIMHEHTPGALVFITDGEGRFTYPDVKTEESNWNAGEVGWSFGEKHLPENLSDEPYELILVEIRDKQPEK